MRHAARLFRPWPPHPGPLPRGGGEGQRAMGLVTLGPDCSWATILVLAPATIAAHEAVVIITNHAAVDYAMVAAHAPLVDDTPSVYRGEREHVVKA